MAGFFFLGFLDRGPAPAPAPAQPQAPPVFKMALALDGRPLAMAELDVCWEMARGSLDLS